MSWGWMDRPDVRLKALHHLVGDKGCLVGHKASLGCFVHPAKAGAWPWSSPKLGNQGCWPPALPSPGNINWRALLRLGNCSIRQQHPQHCTAQAMLPREEAHEVLFMEDSMSSVGWGWLCRTLGCGCSTHSRVQHGDCKQSCAQKCHGPGYSMGVCNRSRFSTFPLWTHHG